MLRRLSSLSSLRALAVPAAATAIGLSVASSNNAPAESQAFDTPKGLSTVHPPTVRLPIHNSIKKVKAPYC